LGHPITHRFGQLRRRKSQGSTESRQSEPNPQRQKHSINRLKLRLELLHDPSMTSNATQITSALERRQRIELPFQELTNVGLPTIKHPPEVLGLLQVSVWPYRPVRDVRHLSHGDNIDPVDNSCPIN
jgi:hypothetical protein